LLLGLGVPASGASQVAQLPPGPLVFGGFTALLGADGTFALRGGPNAPGWPEFKGSWKASSAGDIALQTSGGEPECAAPGRYRFRISNRRVTFDVVDDACVDRRMIMDRSTWRPAGEVDPVPERRLVVTRPAQPSVLPRASSAQGSWPSFRGAQAAGVGDGQGLPDSWDGQSGRAIAWRTPIPGLAHSSPVVWGDRLFVTTAISSRGSATFKPGLYGDGDASDDRSSHRWMVYALDKQSGRVLWERIAYEGEPRNKRHIKSTYASSTPATDGRIVVAWFGSQGVYAYGVDGSLLWSVDLGRLDIGAYDIPTYEWGPASSPIIWNNLVILQCDTQADSFLVALNAETGATVWKAAREELPSWGTPTIATTMAGPELVTNASNYIRGYDPRTGRELWRLGRSSKITAPTPVFGGGTWVIASGRAPERPIFAVRPGARGDITPPADAPANQSVIWSRTNRGSYMPTPLIYGDQLYVLANNGILDAYDLKTGDEIYRQRLPYIGSGYSASPVAADGRIYLSSEDGEMLVVRAGRTFEHLATNSMGETLMATPALSERAMYVRGAANLFAVGTTGR
jgi:outer membrane protein assembly factor BamB